MSYAVNSFTALRTALKGINSGYEQFAKAANEVQRAAADFHDNDRVTLSREAQALASGGTRSRLSTDVAVRDEPASFERGLVDMRLARFTVLANLAAMSTSNEMLDEALKIAETAHRFERV